VAGQHERRGARGKRFGSADEVGANHTPEIKKFHTAITLSFVFVCGMFFILNS
jgi:hypothetical protein